MGGERGGDMIDDYLLVEPVQFQLVVLIHLHHKRERRSGAPSERASSACKVLA